MNTGNTDALGLAGGTQDEIRDQQASTDNEQPHRRSDEGDFIDQQENFRLAREESLKLCDGFQAFYAANPAYHLEL